MSSQNATSVRFNSSLRREKGAHWLCTKWFVEAQASIASPLFLIQAQHLYLRSLCLDPSQFFAFCSSRYTDRKKKERFTEHTNYRWPMLYILENMQCRRNMLVDVPESFPFCLQSADPCSSEHSSTKQFTGLHGVKGEHRSMTKVVTALS